MRRLSFIIGLLVFTASLFAQKSPHGNSFRANCDDCHKTDGWKIDLKTLTFDHNKTKFTLVGQHKQVTCKDCHKSLEFAKAQTECNACHTDIHEQTVGNECARCHTPNSWVVTGITQLHQLSRFPLIGSHATAECKDCHINMLPSNAASGTASRLRFDPLGVQCFDCHRNNYQAATKPNHVQGNYSTNCTDCHKINSFSWAGAGINHDFFPLEGGHAINDCFRCHISGSYSKISAECFSCHQTDYASTSNPNHTALNFSTNCKNCHSLNPGWKPAEYREHDAASFPIYSGTHKGEWNNCADCHTNPGNYSQFSCTTCHEHNNKSEVDSKHNGVSGYSYNSVDCFACHPSGSAEGSFNHNKSSFPLTGAHISTACINCHKTGYIGTPNACASCHTSNYNQTTNPKHAVNNISNDCALCHTTNPGWNPATFPTHNNYYVLAGSHVSKSCNDCHNGNYTNTPNTCAGCHTNDFNQATNPNHITSQFPKTCETCHTQIAWVPSTFNHTTVYPLTGAHIPLTCTQCHTSGYINTPNTCAGCHQNTYNQTTNPNHNTIGISNDCALCHSTNPGWEPALFPTHNSYYVLAGAHISRACADCHNGNYNNTPKTCEGCHTNNYNQTTNPNHAAALFPKTCETCHNQSSWTPSTWNHDGLYFPIYSGKHAGQWNTCSDCHKTASNFASYTCIDCHEHSNSTDLNNKHNGIAGYTYTSVGCYTCHPRGTAGN